MSVAYISSSVHVYGHRLQLIIVRIILKRLYSCVQSLDLMLLLQDKFDKSQPVVQRLNKATPCRPTDAACSLTPKKACVLSGREATYLYTE